jgi:hypothetical protein
LVKNNVQPLGLLPPLYHFALNPYPLRFSRCPDCKNRTGTRKLPLLICIKPSHWLLLNFTCRYCPRCDQLVCHQDALEHVMATLFEQRDPSVIGNEYFVFGTVEKGAWKEGLAHPTSPAEMVPCLHDFKSYREIRMTVGGLFKVGQEPPHWTPPPPAEWVKRPGR